VILSGEFKLQRLPKSVGLLNIVIDCNTKVNLAVLRSSEFLQNNDRSITSRVDEDEANVGLKSPDTTLMEKSTRQFGQHGEKQPTPSGGNSPLHQTLSPMQKFLI